MKPIYNNDGEIETPEGLEIPVDKDAQELVQEPFVEPSVVDVEKEEEPELDAEPTVNNTPAPEGEPAPDPAPEPTPDSSLTPEPTSTPEPEPQEPAFEPEVSITEESVLSFLSEKLGKEVTSLEDLAKTPEPTFQDEELKALIEWKERTGRSLSDWSKFQKDYDAMSHEEVAREYLRYKYEDLTTEEIEMELQQYIATEEDLDNEAARKRLNLKKVAMEGKKELNALRMNLDTPVEARLNPEQKQAIEFYQQAQAQQTKVQEIAKVNDKNITGAIDSVETLNLALDKDNTIDFKPSQEARKSLKEFMKMPAWYNQDGTINGEAIVKDSFFLQNREAIIQEAFKQGMSLGKASIEKETNNVTLSQSRATPEGSTKPEGNGIEIEGLEEMIPRRLQWK